MTSGDSVSLLGLSCCDISLNVLFLQGLSKQLFKVSISSVTANCCFLFLPSPNVQMNLNLFGTFKQTDMTCRHSGEAGTMVTPRCFSVVSLLYENEILLDLGKLKVLPSTQENSMQRMLPAAEMKSALCDNFAGARTIL